MTSPGLVFSEEVRVRGFALQLFDGFTGKPQLEGPVTVGITGGKASPLLVKALTDTVTAKRAGAAEALARSGLAAHRPAVRKLLADSNQTVRARVAIALVESKDKEAIPALIDLVEKGTIEDRERIETLLVKLAGEKAPPTVSATR